jgi:hypothetical protein
MMTATQRATAPHTGTPPKPWAIVGLAAIAAEVRS